jgi:hypothetical protein
MLMGVGVDTVAQSFTAESGRADRFDFPAVSSPDHLAATDTNTWRILNQHLQSGKKMWRDPATGNFILERGARSDLQSVRPPRIGLYKSFIPVMDEGWTRWLLEQFGFRYANLSNREIHAGNLRERFDVIVVPDQRAEAIHLGYKPGSMPEQYTGGVGDTGAEALKQFVSKGGTIVFLNDASEYATEYLGLSVKDALTGISSREFYAPGTLLNARLADHPLTLGLPKDVPLWFESGPAFEVSGRDRAVATYPDTQILASGWLLGEKHLARRAAIVDAPMGSGHIILFGIRPQYRAQSYQAFKLFFNSLLYFE